MRFRFPVCLVFLWRGNWWCWSVCSMYCTPDGRDVVLTCWAHGTHAHTHTHRLSGVEDAAEVFAGEATLGTTSVFRRIYTCSSVCMEVRFTTTTTTTKRTRRHTEAIPTGGDGEEGRAVVCVSADPKIRGLALCAEGAGGRRRLVVDPLASRVEVEALVAGGMCVCFFVVFFVCVCSWVVEI